MITLQQIEDWFAEDIGSGDITAELLAPDQAMKAQIITREPMVLCGCHYAQALFHHIDPAIKLIWSAQDGDHLANNDVIVQLQGLARSLLTAERCVLNVLQTLSATATTTARYVAKLKGYTTKILDTRKTIPGWRQAQKYAVSCGGGYNHRMGLYDAFLIKENHILACGSITAAIDKARQLYPDKLLEIEVENLIQYQKAQAAWPDRIMLDNFSLEEIEQVVAIRQAGIKLEVSGNITIETIEEYAKTGVDYISIGALTKNIQAIDLSMRAQSSFLRKQESSYYSMD